MSTITVRLNSEEEATFNEYAKLVGMPLSTLLKKTLEEKLEYEFDMKSIEDYEKNAANKSQETYDHEEIKKMLGL